MADRGNLWKKYIVKLRNFLILDAEIGKKIQCLKSQTHWSCYFKLDRIRLAWLFRFNFFLIIYSETCETDIHRTFACIRLIELNTDSFY